MSWLRRSRPAYAVDGVEPYRNSDGWDVYSGATLAGRPAVAEAVARLPRHPVVEYLLYSVAVGTPDGHGWSLSFGDESRTHFDLSHPGDSDIFEEALAAAPFTESTERVDRDIFAFTTTEAFTADAVLAHCLDVCGEVLRRLNGPSS